MSDQDDLTVDFTDSESYGGGFDPIPRGWYTLAVTDAEAIQVKKEGGNFPQGTPGTKWELTVDDGEYENRKVWVNHWHHPKSVPFLKGFLVATGAYTEDELSGPVDINEARDKAIGRLIKGRVVIKPAKGEYEATNELKSVKPVGADVSSSSDSLLP